jgi:hypothetical protein
LTCAFGGAGIAEADRAGGFFRRRSRLYLSSRAGPCCRARRAQTTKQEQERGVAASVSAEDLSDLKTLSQRQAAAAIGVSPRTLARMTARGEGPPCLDLGFRRLRRYSVVDLRHYLALEIKNVLNRNEPKRKVSARLMRCFCGERLARASLGPRPMPATAPRSRSVGRTLTFAAGEQPGIAGRGGDRSARKYGGRSLSTAKKP